MAGMTKMAQKHQREREEQLRKYLSNQKLAQRTIERIDKMGQIRADAVELKDGSIVADVQAARFELDKLSAQNRDALKLLNKYLPDMRQLELAGDEHNPIAITSTTFVGVGEDAKD